MVSFVVVKMSDMIARLPMPNSENSIERWVGMPIR
jgi:hypothetical protein